MYDIKISLNQISILQEKENSRELFLAAVFNKKDTMLLGGVLGALSKKEKQ